MPPWLATPLTVFSILAHVCFSFTLYPRLVEMYPPLLSDASVRLTTGAFALVPVLNLLTGGKKAWQSVVWWSFTPAMGVLVLVVKRWIDQAKQDIRELEKLKYVAKGA
jgi:hypothetical protein